MLGYAQRAADPLNTEGHINTSDMAAVGGNALLVYRDTNGAKMENSEKPSLGASVEGGDNGTGADDDDMR